jgi:AraC family transcriptional regulator of adaptative response/methylated-DNA-[protein]-cysteine methyltransferase
MTSTKKNYDELVLRSSYIKTKLGTMLAVASSDSLYLLEFADKKDLEEELKRFKQTTKVSIVEGSNQIIKSIESELEDYFSGKLTEFKTPIRTVGTKFQQLAWNELKKVPYGQTRSYAAQSNALGKPTAYRAVANANGANHLAIIIPCHRIINSNGALGGYAGGLPRKKALIEHEKSYAQ